MTVPLLLVADDDPGVREAVRQVMADEGFRVAEASDGDETLSLLHRLQPDLLLLDLSMPGIGGDSILAHLDQTRVKALPCLIITGHDRVPEWILTLPHAKLLRKPFGVAELRAAVRALMSPSGSPSAPSPPQAGR